MAKDRWKNLRDRETGQRAWRNAQRENEAERLAEETETWARQHKAQAARRPPVPCHLECLACRHQGDAVARPGQHFVCSQCGSKRIKVTYRQ